MGQRGIEGFNVLTGQQGAHGLDGALHRHRHFPPQFGECPVYAFQPCLDVEGVLAGLQQQQVDAAFDESGGLDVIIAGQFLEGDAAGDRDGLGGGAHGAGDEPGFVGGGRRIRRPPGQRGGLAVEALGLVGQAVLGQHHRRGAEGIGLNDVGAGLQVTPVYFLDDIGPGEGQVLVAPFVFRASEVIGSQVAVLDGGAHGPVHHQQALGQCRFQFINTGIS